MATTTATTTKKEPNPIVFMDVSVGGQLIGRIKMELFKDRVPKTAENFRQLCVHASCFSIPINTD